jgi:guanylate kinase
METGQTMRRKLLVLVGQPGVGKKFCTLRLNGNHPMDVEIVKTLTTQPQRQIYDSLFYKTVDPEAFQKRMAAGDLLEHDAFAGHWYGLERTETEAVLKQKHGVVSSTPYGVETLRSSGLPLIIAYLYPASKSLIEDNLRKKQEDPERLRLLQQSAAVFERLPENAYDIAVAVKSLVDAERELEEKLATYMELH